MLRYLLAPLFALFFLLGNSAAAELAITTAGYPSGIAGTNYSALSGASGGTGSYTWTIASGALPGGTSLNPATGVISGTPAAGHYAFTVQVGDTITTASKPATIDIYPRSAVYDSGGEDIGTAIATDGTGHVYVAGYTNNGTNNDYRTIKYNTDGSVAWLRSYDSGGNDEAYGVAVDAAENVYVVGSRAIVKYDQSGEVSWTRDFAGTAKAVTVEGTAYIYVGGATAANDRLISKYDAAGEVVWSRSNTFPPTGIALDGAGNVIVASSYDVAKYDNTGLLLWSRRIETLCYPPAKGSVGTDAADNIYGTICGTFFKFSPDGTLIWQKSGSGGDGFAIKGDDIFIAGNYVNTQQVFYRFDRWKTDGTAIWTDTYGGNFGYSYPAALALTPTGDAFFVTGRSATTWGTTSPNDMRTVAVAVPKLADVDPIPIKPGAPFTVTLKATGGTPPYIYSCLSGSTDPTTGVLTGTFTDGGAIHEIACYARDSLQLLRSLVTDRKVIQVLVYGIATKSLPPAIVGSPYTSPIDVIAGVAPYRWTLASGSLPPGLSLDYATGTISGTPQATGSWQFTVQVLDAEDSPATATLTINVYEPLVIVTTSLPFGTIGSAYNQTIAVSGGLPPYTWSVVSGTLSPLSLNSSTGAVTGTSNNPLTLDFIVQVKDANGFSTTQSYTLHVAIPLSLTLKTMYDATVGSNYSDQFYGGWGVSPYDLVITGGQIPTGMTYRQSYGGGNIVYGVIEGTPSVPGPFSFTAPLTYAVGAKVTAAYSITVYGRGCSTLPVGVTPAGSSNSWLQYYQLQDAYDAAGSGDAVWAQAREMTGQLLLSKDIDISLRGGCDCGYAKMAWYTVLHGSLTIASGSVTVEDLIID